MTIKSHKTILNLFFCAFALITLSACNAGGGGGGAGATFAIDPGPVDPTIGYQASAADEIPPDDGWVKALSDARTTEYGPRWRKCRPNRCRILLCKGLYGRGHDHFNDDGTTD